MFKLEDGIRASETAQTLTMQEGLKHGVDGWVDDDFSFAKPWGFQFDEIQVPVFLYHGGLDKMVPYSHGQWQTKRLPQKYVTAHLEEGEGHISIVMGKLEQMLDELLSAAAS